MGKKRGEKIALTKKDVGTIDAADLLEAASTVNEDEVGEATEDPAERATPNSPNSPDASKSSPLGEHGAQGGPSGAPSSMSGSATSDEPEVYQGFPPEDVLLITDPNELPDGVTAKKDPASGETVYTVVCVDCGATWPTTPNTERTKCPRCNKIRNLT